MGWEDESKYARKTDLEDYAKKSEIPKIPDHSIYALKKDIPIFNMNDYIKRSEIERFITENTALILNNLLPHLNHRYCTNELFNKIRYDLNVKLKKLDHRWTNV